MHTFLIDSRFVNAAIYLLFDVTVFFILSLSVQALQSHRIANRLRNGHRVKLRESSLGKFAGGVISDGSVASYLCMLTHLSLLITFFLLTLGINGRSQLRTQRATRQYITRIAAGDDDYNPELHQGRLRPQLFSDCKQQSGNSLAYYPTAFDTERNIALHDFFAFTDEQGKAVNINASTTLCQNQGSFAPMLVVSKCGNSFGQCSNVQIANQSSIRVLGATGDFKNRWEESIHVYTGNNAGRLLVMYRNIQVVEEPQQPALLSGYNRVICKELPLQGEESTSSRIFMNCVIGAWMANGTVFTFRLGELILGREQETWDALNRRNDDVDVDFVITSAQVEIEWEAWRHGEVLFADTLTAVGQDYVSPRSYLDSIVSRTVVADNIAADGQVVEELTVNVTDILNSVGVAYLVLASLAVIIGAYLVVTRCRKHEEDMPDVTSYSGLSELLRSKCAAGNDAPLSSSAPWTYFEIGAASAAPNTVHPSLHVTAS